MRLSTLRLAPRPVARRPAGGFTLVEQLAAITIAGVASVTALPALVQFESDAQSLALASLASTATSAAVLNQAGCLVTQQVPQPGKCQSVSDCQHTSGLLMAGLPAGYRILPGALGQGTRTNGIEGSCTLQRDSDGVTAVFRSVTSGL